MKKISLTSLDKIDTSAKEFISTAKGKKIFAFYGEMGAGKTTFIKAICKQLGVKEIPISPTFAIINEYNANNKTKIFHFDFYRIKNIRELLDIGIEEYFYQKHYCFIEWPEIGECILPDETINVRIEVNKDYSRTIMLDI